VNNHNNDHLQLHCPTINRDIPICQNVYGKKILLSVGGGTADYALTGTADGIALAEFLWGAFGPRTQAWVDSGKPRPFDGPNGEEVQVDGFDLDIEFADSSTSSTKFRVHLPS
jgi:chitinase